MVPVAADCVPPLRKAFESKEPTTVAVALELMHMMLRVEPRVRESARRPVPAVCGPKCGAPVERLSSCAWCCAWSVNGCERARGAMLAVPLAQPLV